MKLSDFDYEFPEKQIAQYPLNERDSSNLLVLHKKTNKLEHRIFRDLVEYLRPGDVLILNDTKVTPVRLCGIKHSGGKAEITLLKELDKNTWEALVRGVHEGKVILTHGIIADVSRLNGTVARVKFNLNSGLINSETADIKDFLNEIGVMPLPVYIKRESVKSDAEQYQTIYAKEEGAIAAPTAGLHFTDKLLNLIKGKGIEVKTITLHVGHGTFKPVTVADIRDHQMDEEFFEIPERTAVAVNSAKSEGRRIIAVGTTVTRALEASATPPIPPLARRGKEGVKIKSGKGKASIFIYRGYRFQIIDAIITNFHLPKSTPVMLTSAFSGLSLLKKAYAEAQKKEYRLFSYGDAMLIL
jgi:S-adenosylmethionine:tRNA ribosyltransferase-isomerase